MRTSSSPFFFQLVVNHGAGFLPFDHISMFNATLLAGFNNRIPWTTICKISLHDIWLLSEGIVSLVQCTLPHHGCEENMVGTLVMSKKKVMR